MTDQTCYDLPSTQHIEFFDDSETGGLRLEFRLVYKGPLPAEGRGGGRARDKQRLRKEFHKQLRELWRQDAALKDQAEQRFVVFTTPHNKVDYPGPGVRQINPVYGPLGLLPGAKTWVEHIADDHQRCGGRFVPLVNKGGGFTCSLDILFLRRDAPGGIIVHGTNGGDIDNRLKVLLDGLKMPETLSDLGDLPIDSDEDPFFCLLEDDGLIANISVTTDRLLVPLEDEEKLTHVYLVIHVTVINPSAVFAGGRLV